MIQIGLHEVYHIVCCPSRRTALSDSLMPKLHLMVYCYQHMIDRLGVKQGLWLKLSCLAEVSELDSRWGAADHACPWMICMLLQ